ncbi:PTS galactitol transporter subunit IIC [Heyndrickxia acidiproducens]|uniref:PTS galactitol transporter subunit IIC n=1 Tax=Heyndrickxia acidiproducens TaxID=1121084 RepID=UPI0003774F31|nr:PTS transporter subunit IIC [Heyndrickxia acidiproducens]
MVIQALHWFINLGSSVFIPIVIFILGLLIGVKPIKALISGITIGIGFIGLNLVVGLLQSSLGDAINLMVSRFGLKLNIIDLGSGPGGPLAFSTTLGVIIIPVSFAINLLLVSLGWVKTLNVDVWNLWQSAFMGLLVYGMTGSFWMGVAAMVPTFLLALLLADIMQPLTSKFFNLPGIAITHLMALSGLILAIPLKWVFDRIPGLNKLDASPEKIQKKFGSFGDPILIGLVIGVIIGILAGFSFAKVALLGMQMAAILKLLPKMISMFMEGLMPISEAAQKFADKHLHGRKVNIGMDAALTVGHPAVISSCLLLIPVSLFLAVILPGNQVLPFGDLPLYVFVFTLMVAAFRGNIIHSVIGGAIYTVTMLYLSTWLAPLVTKAFQIGNYDVGHKGLVTFVSSGLWPAGLFVGSIKILGWFAIIALTIIILGSLFYLNKIKKYNSGESEVN